MTCAASSVSDKKLQANRLNALKSTGPRTAEGKQRSSRNAITHGIFARHLLLEDESPEELRELKMSILKRLNPRDMLELQIVDQIVCDCWMSRRARMAEQLLYCTRMVQTQAGEKQRREEQLTRLEDQSRQCQSRISHAQTRKHRPDLVKEYKQAEKAVKQAEQKLENPPRVPLAAELMMHMFEEDDQTLDQLQRYGRRLEYSLNRCLNQLRKLREESKEQEQASELVQEICQQQDRAEHQSIEEEAQGCETKPPQAEEQPGPEDGSGGQGPVAGGQCSQEVERSGGEQWREARRHGGTEAPRDGGRDASTFVAPERGKHDAAAVDLQRSTAID